MAVRVVRLGQPRTSGEGLRLGTVRRPPRGVRKEQYASLDFFDVWMPELAPSAPLVSWALSEPWTDKRWAKYERSYRSEMKSPAAARLLSLLAAAFYYHPWMTAAATGVTIAVIYVIRNQPA